MAGGPSTPALAAGVNRAGGLGFLAAGYLTPDRLQEDLAALR
jgi:nitronate monooxygenase